MKDRPPRADTRPKDDKPLFGRPWIFIRGVPAMKFLPPEGPVEIAFAGRSNVGKSSLINALVGHKGLARTSNTPGRTQELNYFVPDGFSGEADDLPPMALVDMPGYGYAQAPKEQVDAWTKLVFDYLRGRSTLKRVYVLIDARHGIKKNDEEVLGLLDKAAVSYQIVLTKKLGETVVSEDERPAWNWPTASKIETISRSRPSSPMPGRIDPP